MKTICVTGAAGLIGQHSLIHLRTQPDLDVISVDREMFRDPDALRLAVGRADVLFHFAGQNRGDADAVAAANVEIADQLVDALHSSGSNAHVLFSNSIHSDGETPYGQSKRAVADRLRRWTDVSNGTFSDVLLPHVFGEFGRPFYNSVVSTFCHQIATGETPEIQYDGDVELLHAGQVAELFWETMQHPAAVVRPSGVAMKVSELLARLKRLSQRYAAGVVPDLTDVIDLQLFNTYRSYIPYEDRPISLTVHSDARGGLFEAIRSDAGGQVFLSNTRPGITRGNHFHRRKVERFLVVQGSAIIRLRNVLTDQVHTFEVSGERPQAIDIPTLHTHNISNVGEDELWTLFWAHEHFNPDDSDTYFLEV